MDTLLRQAAGAPAPGKTPTALICDMGNVLIHYDPPHFLDRAGITDPVDRELLLGEIFYSPQWPGLDEGSLTEADLEKQVMPRLPERLHGVARQLLHHWDEPIEPMAGMAELLARCKGAGMSLYLLSNASLRQPQYWPRVPGSQLFDGTVVSAFYRQVKPQPEIYRTALEKFHLQPEACLFVDDLEQNIRGAAAVGIPGFLFSGDAAALEARLRALGVPLPEGA